MTSTLQGARGQGTGLRQEAEEAPTHRGLRRKPPAWGRTDGRTDGQSGRLGGKGKDGPRPRPSGALRTRRCTGPGQAGHTVQADREGPRTRLSARASSYLGASNTEPVRRKREKVCEERREDRQTGGPWRSLPTASPLLPPGSGLQLSERAQGGRRRPLRVGKQCRATGRFPHPRVLPVLLPAGRCLWGTDCQRPREAAVGPAHIGARGAPGTLLLTRPRLAQDPVTRQTRSWLEGSSRPSPHRARRAPQHTLEPDSARGFLRLQPGALDPKPRQQAQRRGRVRLQTRKHFSRNEEPAMAAKHTRST